MRIETNINGWIIRSDNMNIILCRSAGMVMDKKLGRERELFRDETFHRDIQGALESLCRKEIYASKATTLKELNISFEELRGAVSNMAESIGEVSLKRTLKELTREEPGA